MPRCRDSRAIISKSGFPACKRFRSTSGELSDCIADNSPDSVSFAVYELINMLNIKAVVVDFHHHLSVKTITIEHTAVVVIVSMYPQLMNNEFT